LLQAVHGKGEHMAQLIEDCMPVADAGLRAVLRRAALQGGREYELALGGSIARRSIPVLERIEQATGIAIAGVSLDRTRGPRSSQSRAWFQWQRGHRQEGLRWPDATIEFKGPGGVVSAVYALEISLQTDFTKIGSSPVCAMSMAKASQMALTAALLANKPAYRQAQVHYWYLCPWQPAAATRVELLTPLQNMVGTDSVTLTWLRVDHGA
jgi:hypothetical protein